MDLKHRSVYRMRLTVMDNHMVFTLPICDIPYLNISGFYKGLKFRISLVALVALGDLKLPRFLLTGHRLWEILGNPTTSLSE